VRPSVVGARAAELGYPVEKPLEFGTRSFVAHLAEWSPDAFVVVAYGKLLKKRHLDIPPLGCVNVHPSLLPRHRGAVPIQSSLLAGDDVTGVTTMRMDIGLDTGDMLLQRAVPVETSDDAGRLHDRLARLGAELLVDTLDGLEAGSITPCPQNDAQATVCQRLTKDDGRLDWSKDARSLYRHVRAMNPWPSAFTARGDTRVTVRRAEVWDVMPTSHAPGTVAALDRERGPVIACGEGSLLLTELQPAGRKAMTGDAFLRGTDVSVGEGWR
jgi:methionyl-tRNA formyltransferase